MRRIPRNALPLCSSRELIRALKRLGAYEGKRKRGSHVPYHRNLGDRTLTAVVIMGKREIPRGTLQDILFNLEVTLEEFREAL